NPSDSAVGSTVASGGSVVVAERPIGASRRTSVTWSRVDAEGIASHTMQMVTTPTPRTPTAPAARALERGPRLPSAPLTEHPSAPGTMELRLGSGQRQASFDAIDPAALRAVPSAPSVEYATVGPAEASATMLFSKSPKGRPSFAQKYQASEPG